MQTIKNKIFTLFTLLFLLVFGGFTTEAWGGQAHVYAYSSPQDGGYVYVANSNAAPASYSKTKDEAQQGGFGSSGNKTFYLFYSANEGYEFISWVKTTASNYNNATTITNTSNLTSQGQSVVQSATGVGAQNSYYAAVFKALPKFYFKAIATTNNSTYGNAYVTFTESNKSSATTSESTTNCYGTHYNTASMTKTAYFRAAPKTGYVFKGWSTDNTEANIFNTATSITYDLTSSSKNSESPATIQYYAIFGEKFAPQITGTASVDKKVGDSYTADFTFKNTSSATPSSLSTADFYYTITHELSTSVNNGTNVISYNPSTGEIQTLNAGKATITFINKSTSTHQNAEVSFVINVSKKTPTFSCGTSMKVGEDLTCTYTNTSDNTPTANSSHNFYYVFTNNTPTGNVDGSDTPGSILTFSDNKVYGKNAGTATITFYQKETYMYSSANKAIEITVSKHEPVFHWNDAQTTNNTPYYYNSKIYDIFSTSSPNEYSFDSKNPASAVAVKGTKDTLIIYNVNESATITVKQKENYKHSAKSQDYVINPVKKDNHVEFTVSSSNRSAFWVAQSSDVEWDGNGYRMGDNGWSTQDDYFVITFSGLPDKLTFDRHLDRWGFNLPETYLCRVYESADGTNWSTEPVKEINEQTQDVPSGNVQLQPTTRYLKFTYHGTVYCHFNNIHVTELQYFKTTTESLNFGDKNQINDDITPKSFKVEHANAGYQTTVIAPEHYAVSVDNSYYSNSVVYSTNDTKHTGGDIKGEFTVYVKYLADEVGEHTGDVVVQNNLREDIHVSVTGKTLSQRDPVLRWNIGTSLRANTTYTNFVTSTNKEDTLKITTSNELLVVTREETNDGDNIYVLTTGNLEENAETIKNLTITVTQDETENYNAASDELVVSLSPRVNVCLPVEINKAEDTETIQNMAGSYVGTHTWCGSNDDVENNYIAVKVKYTQRAGLQLGAWYEGLNSLGDDFWENVGDLASQLGSMALTGTPKSIEMSFSGSPATLSFDATLQSLSFKIGWGSWTQAQQESPTWTVYQIIDGEESEIGTYEATYNTKQISVQLSPRARSVRIELHSAFAGFIQNLKITRKREIVADKNPLIFGDADERPLQKSQTLSMTYYSIGSCEAKDTIKVVSTNEAFYVDVYERLADINEIGNYIVRVRCTDVDQSGELQFKVGEEVLKTVTVTSENPVLTSDNSNTKIFETGTEQVFGENSPYRGITTYNFSECFDGTSPRFDILYIYGVSASAVKKRLSKEGWKNGILADGWPAIDLAEGNVHTPCFVYAKDKDNNRYVHTRTFDAATTTLNISAADKEIAFMGYKPASLAADAIPAIQLSGNNAKVYLDSTEINASGVALMLNDTVSVYSRGNNKLIANSGAAVQLAGDASLTIEDSWCDGESHLALIPSTNKPSIDLGSAKGQVVINGSQLELHNAIHMAIAHMDGDEEHFDGEVHINDGTITRVDTDTLGMPKLTFIDGGTFNDVDVVAYTLKGKAKRPRNSHGEIVSRKTMSKDELKKNYSLYGQNHLTLDGSDKVNPMLMGDEVCVFNGSTDSSAEEEKNWNKKPTENDDVLINAPMVISGEELKVKSLTINWEDISKGTPAVTVNSDGGLTVGEGGIDVIKLATPKESLVLKAGTDKEGVKGQTGFLRIHPESAEPMPEATVELFSIGFYDMKNRASGNDAAFQYVGAPVMDNLTAKDIFTRSWIYSYIPSTDQWVNDRANLEMEPFVGYATTQFDSKDGKLITYTGHIVNNSGIKTIDLNYTETNGNNLVANSYTAPIDITKFENADFVNVEKTIYIFNTGSKNQAENKEQTRGSLAGQYTTITSNTKGMQVFDEPTPDVIAPMQGFFVKAIEGDGSGVHQLKLDFERLVWGGTHANTSLRAPKRSATEKEDAVISGSMKITLSADGWGDKVYLLESEQYEEMYEDGFDAHKMESGSLNIFTIHEEEKFAIDATNSIAGTRIGVRTGAETTYTMYFSSLNGEQEWALIDTETNQEIDLEEDTEYTFYAQPNSEILGRFQIAERAQVPTTPTGIEGTEVGAKVQKFIKEDQLYILKNGVLYNAQGKVVR